MKTLTVAAALLVTLTCFAQESGNVRGVGVDNEAESDTDRAQQSGPADGLQEGVHYRKLNPSQVTPRLRQEIEVIEIFWYGCGACNALEPHLGEWLQRRPSRVSFKRVHATWRPAVRHHARMFYTAEALGVLDRVHSKIFHEIHVNRNRLATADEVAVFFAEHDISQQKVREIFRSAAVESRLKDAGELAQRYGVARVPTIIINGRYMTSGGMAGSLENVMLITDELVRREMAER